MGLYYGLYIKNTKTGKMDSLYCFGEDPVDLSDEAEKDMHLNPDEYEIDLVSNR